MNKLVTLNKQYATQLRDEVAELGGNGFGLLLKFDWDSKDFMVGKDKVALDRKFIAHCDEYARGWVKFVDGKVVDVRVLKVSEGKPPKRDELDEPMLAGTPDDLWVFQRYLPLEDPQTGEVFVFVTKSYGGKLGLSALLAVFERNYQIRGRPIVRLAVGSFKSRGFGMKPHPSFTITGEWTGDSQNVVTPNEPGPPESDPDDPGYDLLNDFR